MKCIGCNKTIWFWQATRNSKHIDCDATIMQYEEKDNAALRNESKRARRRQLYREKQAAKNANKTSQEQQ